MKFDVLYYKTFDGVRSFSHRYYENWSKTEYFCPACANKQVWVAGDGDYYVGEQHLCAACGASFHLPNGASARDDEQDKQRLERLRAG